MTMQDTRHAGTHLRFVLAPSAVWLAAALGAALAPQARADSFYLGGIQHRDVTIQGFQDNKIQFQMGGRPGAGDIDKLDRVQLTAHPELQQADAALARKQYAPALDRFAAIHKKGVKELWLLQWVDYRIVGAADQAGRPAELVEAYLRLVKSGAQPVMLSKLPNRLETGLKDAEKKALLARIDEVLPKAAAGPAADGLKQLRDLVDNAQAVEDAAPPAPGTPGTPVTAAAPGTPAAGGAVGLEAKVVPLARALRSDDPVTQLILKGQNEQALKDLQQLVETDTGNLGMRLYQKGVAQLHLALARNDQALLKSAGLSFMRVVVYTKGTFVAPSLLEAGFVHQKIGRDDVARKLYDRARLYLDAADDAKLLARCEALIRSLNPQTPAGK